MSDTTDDEKYQALSDMAYEEWITDGGPAFPTRIQEANGQPALGHAPGMSLRDWFAGMALEGDMASQGPTTGEWSNDTDEERLVARAAFLYRMADAMLAARERKGEP